MLLQSAQSDHAASAAARDCSRRAAEAQLETAAPPRNRQSPAGGSTRGPLLPRTRGICAARPLLFRRLHRQSTGALTSRAAFPPHGFRLSQSPESDKRGMGLRGSVARFIPTECDRAGAASRAGGRGLALARGGARAASTASDGLSSPAPRPSPLAGALGTASSPRLPPQPGERTSAIAASHGGASPKSRMHRSQSGWRRWLKWKTG